MCLCSPVVRTLRFGTPYSFEPPTVLPYSISRSPSSQPDPAHLKARFCNLYYKKNRCPKLLFPRTRALPPPVSPFPSHHTSFSWPRITHQTRKERFTAEEGSKRSQRSTYCLLKELLQSLEGCRHRGSAPRCWLLTTSSTLATERSNPTGISRTPTLCQALFSELGNEREQSRSLPSES